MRESAINWAFRLLITVLFAFLILPLIIVVATAFDASGAVVFPPRRSRCGGSGCCSKAPTGCGR